VGTLLFNTLRQKLSFTGVGDGAALDTDVDVGNRIDVLDSVDEMDAVVEGSCTELV
jgi:hypothetical protein